VDPGEAANGWRIAQWIGSAFGFMATLFVGLLGGLMSYHVRRLDHTIARVDDIREKYVTREESLAYEERNARAIDARHIEHVQWMRRIEDAIQQNAQAAKDDRHRVADAVTAIGTQVAILVGRSEAAAGVKETRRN
jgi:hypothetical protein